jgi:hypothetical protein
MEKISLEWTEAERLKVCQNIGIEMLERRNSKNWVSLEYVIEWAERLIYVANMPAEFLEANRKNVVVGYSNIKRSDDQAR